MAAAVLVPVGLFWFAFTSYRSVHWIVPIIAGVPFGMGVVWTFASVFTYLVEWVARGTRCVEPLWLTGQPSGHTAPIDQSQRPPWPPTASCGRHSPPPSRSLRIRVGSASSPPAHASAQADSPVPPAVYHSRLGVVGSNALLAGLTLLMTPLPFLFYRYGKRFRSGSQYSAY